MAIRFGLSFGSSKLLGIIMADIFRRTFTDPKTGQKKKTANYYGKVKTATGWRRVPLVKSAELSKKMLAKLRLQAEAERAGMPVASDAHLNGLILIQIDDFLADKTNEGVKSSTVNRWRTRLEALIAFTKWKLLREVNADQAQEHLAELAATRSPKTLEDLRGDYSNFGRWLHKKKRYPENPFVDLRNPARGKEPVRKPRPLTVTELLAIVASAEVGKPHKRLTGPRRAILYRVACVTGLRSAELASLTAGQVERDAEGKVFVNVVAGCTKNKKTARQAVPEPVASELLRLVAELRPEDRLFPGSWTWHAGVMIQTDARAAGVETVTETPQGKRFVTFHSLRHSFALWLKTSGVPITLTQLMMRHADVKLFTETYGKVDDETLHRAAQGISIKPPAAVPLAHPLAQANGNECQQVTTNPAVDLAGSLEKCLNSGDLTTIGDGCERVTISEKMEWKRIELSDRIAKTLEKHDKSVNFKFD